MSAYRPMSPVVSPVADASRRALLAGALGGIAALAATAIGGVAPRGVRAAVGDPLEAGSTVTAAGTSTGLTSNSDTNPTFVVTQNGKGVAVRARADTGTAGRFTTNARNKFGLVAVNAGGSVGAGAAILAEGHNNIGLRATSDNQPAVDGQSLTHIGVSGRSGTETGVSGVSGTGFGVYGRSDDDSGVFGESMTWYGVQGVSGAGVGVDAVSVGNIGLTASSQQSFGIYASSVTSYAAYLAGSAYIATFLTIPESGDPAAPAANEAKLFVRDSGGKTQLAVRFATGAVQVIATEP